MFQPRHRRRRHLALRIATPAMLLFLIWLVGLFWFAAELPHRVSDPDRPTDAIVVLTGGSGRLTQGLELLSQGRGQKLFVSGVYRGVDITELFRVRRESPDEFQCCVALGHEADDTRGNAVETATWMREQGFASLRLVTANYHMPRSLMEFRHALPETEIVPHPVFPPGFKLSDWWRWPGSAALLATEYSKYLVAWLRTAVSGTGR
jgi:uncharacterized SAM-binding protein YcdF (DUF218 family)